MKLSILVALNDSISSRTVIDYICNLPFRPEDIQVTLLHLFRKPSSGEELMGKKFMDEQPTRFSSMLQNARDKLLEKGFNSKNVETELINETYPTVADGIIDQFKKRKPNMVVIGRKRMSKAEEFVLGDISIKLVRALEGAAVMVVKLK